MINHINLISQHKHLIAKVKLFTHENKIILESIIDKLSKSEILNVKDLDIDQQVMKRISKFTSIKHILNVPDNNELKILELLEEVIRDIKNYELEARILELESKFSKDFNENTFNEIKELKKLQKTN